MHSPRSSSRWIGAVAAGLLLLAPACGRMGDKDVKEQVQKAEEVDKLDQQLHAAGTAESRKLAEAGLTSVAPDPRTLQLTPEQKTALEARVKNEKNSSYQALLQEILDKDKEIASLNGRIAQIRGTLPRPEIAKADDSHYEMALGYLRRKGVSEEKAKVLVSRVLIMDRLAPGFEVYHFYSHGVYGTWVAQGKADQSPTQLQAAMKAQIEGERDLATLKAKELLSSCIDLQAEKERLSADIEALQAERAKMTDDLKNLSTASQIQTSLLNSIHYKVGSRKDLVREGVIVVPVFARDRAGANWSDSVFNSTADLRATDSVTLTAAEAGLTRISKVDVVPGSLEKDKHYTLEFNPDRTAATVRFLAKDRFRNEKVVFALAD